MINMYLRRREDAVALLPQACIAQDPKRSAGNWTSPLNTIPKYRSPLGKKWNTVGYTLLTNWWLPSLNYNVDCKLMLYYCYLMSCALRLVAVAVSFKAMIDAVTTMKIIDIQQLSVDCLLEWSLLKCDKLVSSSSSTYVNDSISSFSGWCFPFTVLNEK